MNAKFRVVKFSNVLPFAPVEVVEYVKTLRYGVQVAVTGDILAGFGSKEDAELFIESGDAERQLEAELLLPKVVSGMKAALELELEKKPLN